MPFKIVRNDITKMNTEAIVNTANGLPIVGAGCDTAVYEAAGFEELLKYRKEHIGAVDEGEVFITPGFKLLAKYIIHAVSPVYRGGHEGEEEKLRSCYRKSLWLAKDNGIMSIAFPLISTGSFGYPKEEGMRIAADEINAFLLKNEMMIYLVVFDEKSTRLGEKLSPGLEAYIDRNYVEKKTEAEYHDELFYDGMNQASLVNEPDQASFMYEHDKAHEEFEDVYDEKTSVDNRESVLDDLDVAEKRKSRRPSIFRKPLASPKRAGREDSENICGAAAMSKPMAEPQAFFGIKPFGTDKESMCMADEPYGADKKSYEDNDSICLTEASYEDKESMGLAEDSYVDFEEKHESKLQERMKHLSDTFSEYLMYLINNKKLSNADVYKRAIVDKKVFSKIKNNPDYHPQKLTALCLCVGAKLNMDETRDLLARAGYALSPCDKTDVIFAYFIENEIYDMIELDIQLEEHGQPCIIS